MITKREGLVVALLALFSLASVAGYSEDRPGLMIYMDPPVAPPRLAQSLSYLSYTKTSVEYGNVTLTGGKTIEIHNAGILAVFPPPPITVDRSSASELSSMEDKARSVLARFPNVRNSIDLALGKWRTALQEAAKRLAAAPQPSGSPPRSAQLKVNGVTYTGVSVESVSDVAVKIAHADGIAAIPLTALSKEQINFLNSTSTSVHIDPDWLEKKQLADQAKAKRMEEAAKTAATAQATPPSSGATPPSGGSGDPASATPVKLQEARPIAVPEEPKPRDLRQALTYYIWSWYPGGMYGRREVHFKRDGTMRFPGDANSGWQWTIVASNKVQIQFDPAQASRVTEITFDAAFSHFQGFSEDGRGTIFGDRERIIAQQSFTADLEAAKAMENRPMPQHNTPTPSGRPISALEQANIAKANARRLEQDQKSRDRLIADAANSAFWRSEMENRKGEASQSAAVRAGQSAAKRNKFDQQWAAQPCNADAFVEPKTAGKGAKPSYAETIEFINGKLAPNTVVGFGETIQKLIFRFHSEGEYTVVVDPADLDADVRFETKEVGMSFAFALGPIAVAPAANTRLVSRVIMLTRNEIPKITIYSPRMDSTGKFGVEERQSKGLSFGGSKELDPIDAKKIANAFSHLVTMLGGKKDAF
jgi:hypothetical protein